LEKKWFLFSWPLFFGCGPEELGVLPFGSLRALSHVEGAVHLYFVDASRSAR